MTEVRHMPKVPGKELPFLVINFFHFPSDEVATEFEREIKNWYPELMFFVGPIQGDVSERYTHCIISLYKDFDEYKRNVEDYAALLTEGGHGELPAYKFDHVYSCRVVDMDDPILQESGLDGWTKRLHEVWGNPKIENPEKVREWSQSIWSKFAADWGAEALTRSGWLPSQGSKSLETD